MSSRSDIAISVRNLSKAYSIAHGAESHTTVREAIMHKLRHPFTKVQRETFWALKDVSFDVQRGDVVGIIGRNGAGKSTLLKVLSRITEPTSGEVDLRGRVGSLLEVGTGFHQELTGRENIALNGAILGMTRREIARQFDAIVEFAGVEQFLDTPVKRYSSGMYVRLAFAVAAHLNPEILVVDEVLAVGDAEFQKKCLGKMHDVADSGRTVLFVSHNMPAVTHLCRRGIVLSKGSVLFDGTAEEAVLQYSSAFDARLSDSRNPHDFRPSWAQPLITGGCVIAPAGRAEPIFPIGSNVTIEMSFRVPETHRGLQIPVMGVVINHRTYGAVCNINMRMTGYHVHAGPHRQGTVRCHLQKLPFVQGRYTVDLWLADGPNDLDTLQGYAAFEIEDSDYYRSGVRMDTHSGPAYCDADWEFEGEPRTSASTAFLNQKDVFQFNRPRLDTSPNQGVVVATREGV